MTLALLGGVQTGAAAQNAVERVEWNRPAEPFRITDNVYYVGTEGLAAYLIVDPAGHVLIDGGLPESAAHIAASIEALGFRLRDVRYLLINHAHFDHSGGLAELKRRTGARLVAAEPERIHLEAGRTIGRPELDSFPAVAVDRRIQNGDTLKLGGTVLTAYVTPGHTPGCTSWRLRARTASVLFACSLTVAGQNLVDDKTYPNAAADFRTTFARLRAVQADVFLNFHPGFFDLVGKRARQKAGEVAAFHDRDELRRQVDAAEQAFERELASQTASRRP